MTFTVDPKNHRLTQEVATKVDQLVDRLTGVDILGDIAAESVEDIMSNSKSFALQAIAYIREHLDKHEAKINTTCNKSNQPCLTDTSCCD